MPAKLKMHSTDLVMSNIEKIAELFPNCITEANDGNGRLTRQIDFDLLRQELSDEIVDGPLERYHLNWPGKREAMLAANAPIAKTFRPCREESVNFDSAQNLFIEGDNLEALKLLQETYLGKVKMIYIDPPYNTGNDYVYNDNFADEASDYMLQSSQSNDEKQLLVLNPLTHGRHHSRWLSFIKSRLQLARNILSEDGVLFISIDDHEVANLRLLCEEIFGAESFIANIIWQKKFARSNDAMYFSTMHDHILCFAKKNLAICESGWRMQLLPRGEGIPAGYSNPDQDPRGVWTSVSMSAKSGSDKSRYKIVTPAGRECYPPEGRYWSKSEESFQAALADNRIWFGADGQGVPRVKTFLSEVQDGLRPNTIWFHEEVGHNQSARQYLKQLFDGKAYFDSPKPASLITQMLTIADISDGDIVLDFFAGSGTTAEAVLAFGKSTNKNIRFIAVQIAESTPEESDAQRDGFKTISSIATERIRRVLSPARTKDTLFSNSSEFDANGDGFRVLKIDSFNMKDVYYSPADTSQSMLSGLVDNIKPDRTGEDLLVQVLLDCGVDLGLPIKSQKIDGCEVFFVNDSEHASPDLVACFDPDVPETLVKTIAAKSPLRAVFRDQCFGTDADKINVEQIFKQLSPQTQLRSL